MDKVTLRILNIVAFLWKQKKVIYYLIIGKESSQNCNTIKNFNVFSSHAHHDHYTKDIFKLENKCKKVVYVLSSDIKRASSFGKKQRMFYL